MEEVWYKDVTYENAKKLVKENLVNTVAAFIASGYWLKHIRDSRGYEKDGYQSLWDCAEAEFGLKISEASRAMSMNDKYSIDGNTPYMAESYKQYNKSQLQEMLTLSDEQMEQVTPDMTVREIREIKNPKAEDSEEKLGMLRIFIKNFVRTNYVKLYHSFPETAGITMERLEEVFEGKLGPRALGYFIMLGYEASELVDANTGEILGIYSSNAVIEMISSYFVELKEIKDIPVLPEIRGLTENPYCNVCGNSLNPPDTEYPDMACARCGQTVDWSKCIKQFCDVAKDETDTVDTECEDELTEDIYTEIEVEPEAEAEEALNIEFDTNELLQELDSEDVIDGEYREIEESQGVSAYGLPKTEYPEGSLLTTEGCGHKYYCFICAKDCAIRQKSRYCCEAPLGNPFDCTTMNVLKSLKNDIGNECQFINLDLAEHRASGEPDPCCKNCQINDCGYRCRRAVEVLPELKDTEEECIIKPEQPALPVFKNNEQRKAWLEDVEAWGLWYEDENIQARYYKYDFPDGSRLIAVKYRYTCPPWMKDSGHFKEYAESDGSYRDAHYHMIYSGEYKKKHKNEYENYYTHATTSITSLVEFVKEITKRGNESE